MSRLEAILFDVDGTLLDTKTFIYAAFRHALLTYNCPTCEDEQLAEIMGLTLEDCYSALAPAISSALLIQAHREFQAENLHLSVPFKNTLMTLQQLRDWRIKVGVVTTRFRKTAEPTLQLAGILGLLDVIITGDDVKKHKPDPEPILLALDKLHIQPDKAMMVGDTDVDVIGGQQAGVVTVGVTYGSHGEKIAQSKPDFVVHDIQEILPIVQRYGLTN